MKQRTSADRLAEIYEEHEALRLALEALDLQLVDAAVDGCDAAEVAAIASAMDDLAARVDDHFVREEAGKYLPDVYEGAPHYSEHADRLLGEHAQLRASLGEVAEIVAAAAGDDARWTAALNVYRRFAERLRDHEHAESALVQRALTEDIGSLG